MAFTPPVSPSYLSITEDSNPYFQHTNGLECNGDSEKSFNNQGLVKCGEASFISEPFSLHSRKNSSYKIFGVPYDTDSQSCSDMERLFCLARKRLCTLAAAPKCYGASRIQISHSEALSSDDCTDFRKELKDFYLMLRYFLTSQDENSKWMIEEMGETIKNGMSLLRLELGWLVDLPRFVQEYPNRAKSSPAYQLFHAHLELRWFELTVLYHLLSASMDTNIDFSQSVFKRPDGLSNQAGDILKEAVFTTVVDLARMAVCRFNWANRDELVGKTMFNCPCVKEMWLLLINFIGKIHQGSDNKHPFWSLIDDVNESLSLEEEPIKTRRTDLTIPKKIKCDNPSLFSLWSLSNLTELFLYDDRGNRHKSKVEGSECNYLALKRALTQLTEESHQCTEEERRVVVYLVRTILDLYSDPKPDAIMILWDFFFRSLDLPFQLPGARAGNFAVMSDTPRGLLTTAMKLLDQEPSLKYNTSYDAFLHLLGNHIEKNPLHWRQKMRGRVFSKLSAKKIATLSELGLLHLVQFFFTVAIKTDLHEVASKLNELLVSVGEKHDTKRRILSAMSRICLILLMAEKNFPFGFVMKSLVTDVSLFVSRGQLEIPKMFVDAIEEILKCNDSLEIDQHLIVGCWINQYLDQVSQDNYDPVLQALVIITKKLRYVANYGSMGPGAVKLAEALGVHVLPFVEKLMAKNGLAPFSVADLAAHLTFLSFEQRSSSQAVNEPFKQLITKFIKSDGSVMLIRRYLWLVLTEKSSEINIRERCSEEEHLLITQAWIRISLFSSNTGSQDFRDLTYQIFRLPVINRLLKFSWLELEQLADTEDPLIYMIESLGRAVDSGKNPGDYRRGVDQLFQLIKQWSNIMAHYSPAKTKDGTRAAWNVPTEVMGQPVKEALLRLYFCMGTLFLRCPRIIFSNHSAQNCILVKSVEQLLIHSNLFDYETSLSVPLDEAIRSTLHLFFIGLYRLDPHREPIIKRFIKELVKIYLPRMSATAGVSVGAPQKNPFIQIWSCKEKDAGQVGAFVLESVADIFMNVDNKSCEPQHSKAVKYIETLIKDFPSNENLYRSVITFLIPGALEMCTKSNDYRNTYKIIHSVLNSSLFIEKPDLWLSMDGALKHLSAKHLSFRPDFYFKILTKLSKDFSHLVKRYLPTLRKDIEEVARKRGVSSDKTLQSYYDCLMKALE